MIITVRFVGILRTLSGRSSERIEIRGISTLRELVIRFIEQKPVLRSALNDLKSNTLVFVNGREISVLLGPATALRNGDEVTFVPVLHGG